MTYDGEPFIYFPYTFSIYQPDAPFVVQDSVVSYNFFILNNASADYAWFDVPVRRGGRIDAEKDFLIDIEVLSGAEGVDFEIERRHTFLANSNSATIAVRAINTPQLPARPYNDPVKFIIHLRENRNFTLNMPEAQKGRETLSRTQISVEIANTLAEPWLWAMMGRAALGYFSAAKFDLINELFGLAVDDWGGSNTTGPSNPSFSGNLNGAMNAFASYLNERIALGPEYAVKDMSPLSDRGYMNMPGETRPMVAAVTPVVIPTEWPAVPGWVGPSGN